MNAIEFQQPASYLRRVHERVIRHRFMRAAPPVLVILLAGCGLLPPESYIIEVDSLSVMPGSSAQAVHVTAHGTASRDGCGGLHRVERRSVGDTLIRRFVGERPRASGVDCTLRPIPLDYTDTITIPAGRTVRYRVLQPSGPPLERELSPP